MHSAGGDELGAVVRAEALEVRDVLEVVGIQIAGVELEVRLDIVVEDDDFKLDVLGSQQILGSLEDFRVRGGGRADDELGGGAGTADSRDQREGENECKNLLNGYLSFLKCGF